MKDLIRKLVEAWGPSGFEHHVRDLIRAEVAQLADEIRVDALGNLICRKGQGGLRVMVAAHMDEIGIMVSHVDEDGYLRFANVGGVFPATLYGGRVKFEDGTIGTLNYENAWGARDKLPDLSGFYIDVSTGDGDSPIKVGDPATFWRPMEERGKRLIAKSMDDRIGCVVAIEALRRLKSTPHEVYFVFTVQEEVGLRGARTAGFGVNPDFALALDVTPTGDQLKGTKLAVQMGKGAAIKVLDVQHIVPPAVKDLLVNTAEAQGIPYQFEVLQLGSTDAAAIQLAQSGVPAGTISIPCRNVHTQSETVDIDDVEACIKLLVGVLENPIEGVRPA